MTTTADVDLQALVTEVTARVITSVGYEPPEEVRAALKQLGYGRCAVCRHPGGPDTLEVINLAPSFACRDQKACLRRQAEIELASELGTARGLVAAYNNPGAGRDTAAVASLLADQVMVIDHLLARLGIPGAELHPELED